MVVFQFLPRKFVIQTWFCNCPQNLCLFHIFFECSPSVPDQQKMLVLPNRLLCWVISTSDFCFATFQPILCHPHTQIRITLFQGERRSIPTWKPSPNRTSIGFSQIAFPIIVLPKDDHADFAQEKRLGLPYWTMILAICVVVDESKCLDTPIWEFSIICEHLPFLLGYKTDTASAACPAQPGNLEMISMTFAAVIWDAEDPCSVNTAWDPESSFTISPRSTTRPLHFWCFASNSAFFKWQMSISEAKWTLCPSSLLPRSPLRWHVGHVEVELNGPSRSCSNA